MEKQAEKLNSKFEHEGKENTNMKEQIYKTYEELPLFLNARTVSAALGVSLSMAYVLMRDKNFPSMRVGNRFVVPKEHFIQWVETHMRK